MAQTVFAPWENPEEKPLIRFRNVTKRFGDFTAIDDLTQDIYAREFFALLGPSGCGKTTLMRMLAGFEQPTEGQILLDGQDIAKIPANKRSVNMMFQSYALFPHLSVWENIAFGLKRAKKPKAEIESRVSEMLRLTHLEKFAQRKPHQISGGQRQRVALARSLARAPKLLLLDEPLGALDRKLREETQFELTDLQYELGMTFLIVTHDQEEAMTMADRIAVMDKGRIVQIATPAEIYELPNSRFVADFIGDINLMECKLTAREGDVSSLHAPVFGCDIKISQAVDANIGDTVWFAIRPEKVRISFEEPESRINALKGEVWDIAYLGDVSIYHTHIANEETVRATVANRSRVVERPMSWDDEVWLSWDVDAGVVLTR